MSKLYKAIKKGLEEAKAGKLIRRSLEEIFEDRETHFPWWKVHVYWPLKRRWEQLTEFPYIVRDYFVRGKRGWANRDVWGFDSYLCEIIVGGLKHLKKTRHGYAGVDEASTSKKWDKCLDDMIFTFETALKIIDCVDETVIMPINKSWTLKWYKKNKKFISELKKGARKSKRFPNTFDRYHVATHAEWKRYEQGWYLFKKFFYNLWD